MLINYKRLAKKVSMATRPDGSRTRRDLKSVLFIVIHYTSGDKDTCYNECDYFATGNTRAAGAHFFVDRDGNCGRSIPMKYIAWHCGGGLQGNEEGSHTYHGICTNFNSVGIELCGISKQYCSNKQIAKLKKLIAYIMKHCPNVKAIIRHWDVTGKECPSLYRGTHNVMWEELLKEVSPFPVEVSDENEIAEPTLKKGDKGTQVSILQKNLNTAGCCGKDGKRLEIDGDFGVNTEYALKLFQKGRGITSDGVYGQKSYEAMKAALK